MKSFMRNRGRVPFPQGNAPRSPKGMLRDRRAQGTFLKRMLRRAANLIIPLGACLLAGALLILVSGGNPLSTYANLFDSGLSCRAGAGRCAFLTTLQFATPLIFSGLSAAVALRAGFFSIGQAGQMLLGAAGACWIGSRFDLPASLHPAIALAAAAFFGALWGLLPALLRELTGANEIIVTLLLNPIAGALSGLFPLGRVRDSARLLPLVVSTKLTAGFPLALLFAVLVYVLLWKTGWGLAVRSAAQAPRFAKFAGINPHKTVTTAMLLSGALAGLAGAVEVLGVHYHYVASFSAVNDFDGLIVAFAGGRRLNVVSEFAWQKGCAGSRTWIAPIRSTSIASGTAPPIAPAECHASPDP